MRRSGGRGASRKRVEEEERLWEKSERKRGKKTAGQISMRGSRRMDGYDGNVGARRDIRDHEGCDAHGRDRASYRGDRRSEMSEGLDRRTILGEVSKR